MRDKLKKEFSSSAWGGLDTKFPPTAGGQGAKIKETFLSTLP